MPRYHRAHVRQEIKDQLDHIAARLTLETGKCVRWTSIVDDAIRRRIEYYKRKGYLK